MKVSSFSSVSHLKLGLATLFLFLSGALAFVPSMKRRILPWLGLTELSAVSTELELERLIGETKKATSEQTPFSEVELDSAILSIQNLAGAKGRSTIDWLALRAKFAECAHLSHKDFDRSTIFASDMKGLLKGVSDDTFRDIFRRVLEDGNWYKASAYSEELNNAGRSEEQKPWAVLVTGLNGIRKTSSIYQPWFHEVLKQALIKEDLDARTVKQLPQGDNCFFRQLDFLVATMANQAFHDLYDSAVIKDDDVLTYARLKDALFARYRPLAEIVGILLVEEAKKRQLNVIVETSGRDIAMFQYMDHCFPKDVYNRLVVHFTINDLRYAERSVDTRMKNEMKAGRSALKQLYSGSSTHNEEEALSLHQALVGANEGGPYGSAQLAGVQAASNLVWDRISAESTRDDDYAGKINRSENWYRASIKIHASDTEPWKAEADTGVDQKATVFEFVRR